MHHKQYQEVEIMSIGVSLDCQVGSVGQVYDLLLLGRIPLTLSRNGLFLRGQNNERTVCV
jgi:hypothetical protein